MTDIRVPWVSSEGPFVAVSRQELERLRDQRAQLLAALRPFAVQAQVPKVEGLDDCLKWPVLVGDLRRAAAAIAATEDTP